MENKFVKLLTAIAFVFLGIMLLLHRSSITDVVVIALGLAAICYAVVHLLRWKSTKNVLNLIIGIALAVCGIFLVLQPLFKFSFYDTIFGILLAIFLIFAGVFLIKEGFSKNEKSRYIGIILGLIVIVLGIITLIRPSLSFLSVLIGIACIAIGGMQIYEFIKEKI